MTTKHEMLCGQRIWKSNNKINQMVKVGISIKEYTYLFSIHFRVCGRLVAILVMVVKKIVPLLSLNSLVNEHLVFIFSTILRKFYLIIVYDLKVKYTINNF